MLIDLNCLQLSYNLLFFINDGLFSYIQQLKYCKRCSFFVPSWLEKEEQLSWLGKKWTRFCKNSMFKKEHFAVVCLSCVVLRQFNSFLKNVSWGALYKAVNISYYLYTPFTTQYFMFYLFYFLFFYTRNKSRTHYLLSGYDVMKLHCFRVLPIVCWCWFIVIANKWIDAEQCQNA